ncbi:MAG: hypothetical protein NVSMB14_05160 [Isosphaeraceae bacterium]
MIAATIVCGAIVPVALAQDATERVRDEARLFDRAAVRRVDGELGRLAKDYGVNVVVETIETLDGRRVDDEAKRRFELATSIDAFLLISKKEHRVSRVLFAPRVEEALKPGAGDDLRNGLIADFKEKRIDAGLERFSRQLAKAVEDSLPRAVATEPRAENKHVLGEKESDSPLVERRRVRLTLAGAKKVQDAAESKAGEMKIKANIAIVDDGGHLLSFARMDGARPASATTAITKAVSAATFRRATAPIGESNAAPDVLLNLSIQNAAASNGGKITTLPGGIPILVDDQVIGAIGVGGGVGTQDVEIAQAGIKALLDELRASTASEKSER